MIWALLLQQPTFPVIDSKAALKHVAYLASDELKGRNTPSAELNKAADYIAAEFKKAKLEPMGDGKTYFLSQNYEGRAGKGEVRNVIGMIRGTDPKLKDTYLLVTAHYDHLGERGTGEDTIYNGANDNASSVAGVIEIAKAMARGKKPLRSVIFMTFWGEEKGLLGAKAYVAKPTVPLNQIVGNLNIEQIGRTDDSEGPRVKEFNLTGFQLSDMVDRLRAAAAPLGVKVTGHPRFSLPYFRASDNFAFAQAGVIAHTASTAYSFPDYHGLNDEVDKIEPEHMALMIRALGAGVRSMANDPKPLSWAQTEEAKPYREKAGG